jgi:hypothetical protein
MTQELIERSRQRHAFAGLPVVLITLSLAVSLLIAATAVSIGISRADALMPAAGGDSGRLMFALFVAFVIAGMGGVTAAMVKNEVSPQRRD